MGREVSRWHSDSCVHCTRTLIAPPHTPRAQALVRRRLPVCLEGAQGSGCQAWEPDRGGHPVRYPWHLERTLWKAWGGGRSLSGIQEPHTLTVGHHLYFQPNNQPSLGGLVSGAFFTHVCLSSAGSDEQIPSTSGQKVLSFGGGGKRKTQFLPSSHQEPAPLAW